MITNFTRCQHLLCYCIDLLILVYLYQTAQHGQRWDSTAVDAVYMADTHNTIPLVIFCALCFSFRYLLM